MRKVQAVTDRFDCDVMREIFEEIEEEYDAINIPEEFKPFVNDYRINVFEAAHLPEEAIGYFHSDFRVVVDYFVHSMKSASLIVP